MTQLKHLRAYDGPNGGTLYYFVATYTPMRGQADLDPEPARPVTVRIRIPGRPGERAFLEHYHRTLDSIQRQASFVG